MLDLDPARWTRISAVLDALLDLPPEERDAHLARACGDDDALRNEVARLWKDIDAVREGESTGARPDLWQGGPLGGALGDRVVGVGSDGLEAGEAVGAYRIVREIGRGGMGAVYLAERADGAYEQAVALKLVKRGLETRAVLRRFHHERRVLARLEHPNVARLLDAGVAEDGRPFFVMEHVEGEPITDYCDRRGLGVERRLGLFEQVGRAVRYAHQNLVVHRDLKPSNVLVAEDGEGRPVVKLLDFGIAKVLHGEGDEEEITLTEAGGRVLTPAYAAPEQVAGAPVTTATDVYALGVLLFELLAGRRPEAQPGTTVRRPSTGVATEAAEVRGTTADGLRRRLRGDLDVICRKALREELAERYASVDELLDDVRRHREGLPVTARPASAGYRVRKFVARHRLGVGATAAVLLALVGGLGAALWQARLAAGERDTARREAATAEQVKDYLVDVFAASDPWENPADVQGTEMTARELLARGVAQVEALEEEPAVQAELMEVLALTYRRLGLYDKAEPLLERALAVRRALWGPEHADVAQSQEALAEFRRDEGTFGEAEALHRAALATRRRLLGEDDPATARSLSGLASTLYDGGSYDEAEELFRAALALDRRVLGDAHPEVAAKLNNLALLLHGKGDRAEAEALFREALAVHRQALGDEHPHVAQSLTNVAVPLQMRGAYAEAEALHREALGLRTRLLGADHPVTAESGYWYGMLLIETSRPGEAEPLLRRSLGAYETALGADQWRTLRTRVALGQALAALGQDEEAETHLREVVAAFERGAQGRPQDEEAARDALAALGTSRRRER